MPTVQTRGGELDYEERGEGPVLVFVAGIMVNGPALWKDVIDKLSDSYRCITPILPIGGHRRSMPDADLTPVGVVNLLLDFLDQLDLSDVTLVGSDSGGALCLMTLNSDRPARQRITRLVFGNCDTFEHFPPAGYEESIKLAAENPREFAEGYLRAGFEPEEGKRGFVARLAHRTLDADRLQALVGALGDLSEVRLDTARYSSTLEPAPLLAATPAIETFAGPVLLIWGEDDPLFPPAHGERLAETFAHATMQTVPSSKCYVMLDAPDVMADAMRSFLGA